MSTVDDPTFTIFVSTFNRRDLLTRVYDSLCAQTFRDFEWLIVDDGSNDGTSALVSRWQQVADFPIRYFWQENAGKHVAFNLAMTEARGCFVAELDSDDAYFPDTLARFIEHWDSIPAERRHEFAGVVGLCHDQGGKLIGTRFPQDVLDSDALDKVLRHRVKGDKRGFFRTDVLRAHPYPVFEGEKRVPASLVWKRIARSYKMRYVNDILAIKTYQPGGISANSRLIRMTSPCGSRLYYLEILTSQRKMPVALTARYGINYVRYSLHAGMGLREQRKALGRTVLWLLCLLPAAIVCGRDRRGVEVRSSVSTGSCADPVPRSEAT
ncbi:MAG: glycosyltransferase family 2 protein [Gemmatimonadetes bacterium]|nr:glycosyltransferase family 2 protein [Gemmatimonadota bacterium]